MISILFDCRKFKFRKKTHIVREYLLYTKLVECIELEKKDFIYL